MHVMEGKCKIIDKDEFMKEFKYYKSNKPKPKLNEVLSVETSGTDQICRISLEATRNDPRADILGLHNVQEWCSYSFPKRPGLILVRNPFTALGQRYWIRKCLEEYPRKPNKLNIDVEVTIQDWWKESFQDGVCNKQLLKKLRWTTLGYHHNWNTKVYTEENKSEFPADLAELSDVISMYLGFSNYKAEAAIVNYYHMNSTLSAHTDHSEVNLEAPLFSFSFGQSAIFLIGGTDKSIKPSALLLNSGDIVVMSKEARLCYHAVPKILPITTSPWDNRDELFHSSAYIDEVNFKYLTNAKQLITMMNDNIDEIKWNDFGNYIKESRINMNVRQVLNERQKCLTDSLFIET